MTPRQPLSPSIDDRDVSGSPRRPGDVAVVVPAAGMGLRLGGGTPKALRELAGKSLLWHACHRLGQAPSVALIVVAAPPTELDAVRAALPQATVVAGGATRQQSVAAALAAVPDDLDIVLVHDAARALAPASLVEAVASAVRGGHDAVVPGLAVVDTVKQVSESGEVVATVDRSVLRSVQTPQGFRRQVLVKAHAEAATEHTDDAGAVERLGLSVHCIQGSPWAFKITTPLDLTVAQALLADDPQPGRLGPPSDRPADGPAGGG